MKNVKVIGWASLLFLLIFSSCREEIIDPTTTIRTPDPIVKVEASVQGQVYDENMNLLQGVSVKMGDDIITTDENGEFRFSNKSINKNGTYITATSNDHFLGAKMFNPELSSTSYVIFQLMNKELTGSFSTEAGGTIQTSDGASVSFGTNSIMYENGTPYSGQVNVFAKWLNPDDKSITDIMPGDLRAINTEDNIVQLATFGMVVVELETTSGQALQISEGNTATITMPVATSQTSTAPSEIPLWSFDEELGYWIEESTATLINNEYVGEVSHFSYWNCDAPFPLVLVNGQVKYTNGLEAISHKVIVSLASNSAISSYGYTNSNGTYGGKMPKDELLDITVENNCGDIIYSGQAGPFSANATIADITISDDDLVILTGTVLDCDGDPAQNSYVTIKGEGNNITAYTEDDGTFEVAVNLCEDGTLTIQGYDIENLKTGPEQVVDASSAGGAIDLGDINLCVTIDEYLTIEIESIDYSYLMENFSIQNTPTSFNINTNGQGQDSSSLYLTIGEEVTGTGLYDVQSYSYSDYEFTASGNDWGLYTGCQASCPQLEVTLFEGTGGYIEAKFIGTVEAYENTTYDEYEIEINLRKILE